VFKQPYSAKLAIIERSHHQRSAVVKRRCDFHFHGPAIRRTMSNNIYLIETKASTFGSTEAIVCRQCAGGTKVATQAGFSPESAALTGAVGSDQPNNRNDVLVVQQLLNIVLGTRIGLLGETGIYDQSTKDKVRTFERFYWNGVQQSLAPDSAGFLSLQQLAVMTNDMAKTPLPVEITDLANKMVGTTKVVPVGTGLNLKGGPTSSQQKSIKKYLTTIVKALCDQGLGDIDMLLMALATIRTETASFEPVAEGVYGGHWEKTKDKKFRPNGPNGGESEFIWKWVHGDTTMKKDPNSPDPDRPRDTKTPLTHPYDVYDFMNGNKGCYLDPDRNKNVCDGELFKGRGFIQITGRRNYESYSAIGVDLVKNPDLALDGNTAAKILALYLKKHEPKIRNALKWGDLKTARRIVNGGANGLEQFTTAFNAGRACLRLGLMKLTQKGPAKHNRPKPKGPNGGAH
jgi:hypothetical protein